MGNGSTSRSSPANKDMVGREARQESWFGVRAWEASYFEQRTG